MSRLNVYGGLRSGREARGRAPAGPGRAYGLGARYRTYRGSLHNLVVTREPAKYGYAVGRIKVREIDLLNRQRLGRLIEADFREALHILEEVDYGDYLKAARVASDVDAGLILFLRDLYSFLEEITPAGSYIGEFLLDRYDFHNLKVLLKRRCCGEGKDNLLLDLGNLEPATLEASLENPLKLPAHMAGLVLEVLTLPEISSEAVDSVVDRRFFEHRLSLARAERSRFMEQFAQTSLDLANLKILLRAKNAGKDAAFLERALADGGHLEKAWLASLITQPAEEMLRALSRSRYAAGFLQFLEVEDEQIRLTEYDKRADDMLMAELHRARHIAVGVEPILGFVRGRENDVAVLRMILMGKLHNLSPEDIERHVRVLYGDRERA